MKKLHTFIKQTPYFLAILVLAVSLFAVKPAKAATEPASLYFAQDSATTGTDLYVQVRANSNAQMVNAVQADFTYTTSVLTYVGIDHTGSAFDVTASESESSGTISIQRGATTAKKGDLLVAKVHFTISGAGTANLTWENSSVLLNAGNDVLQAKINGKFLSSYGTLLVPVYRLFHYTAGDRFWTTSVSERDSILAKKGWKSEGIRFYSVPSIATGAVPVYRLFHKSVGDRFWTSNTAERDSILAKGGWVSEGIRYYTVPSGASGNAPVYRLYHYTAGDRFWTSNTAERDSILAKKGWKTEGIRFYSAQ